VSDDSYGEYQTHPNQWVRTNGLWRTGEAGLTKLFGREDGMANSTSVPFPHQARTSNRLAYFDHAAIAASINDRDNHLALLDPRTLMGGQPSITHRGVEYYMGDEYERTGRTYADYSSGNAIPTVYEARHPQFGHLERTIMGGHHRATAALLKGEPLLAVHVKAPYLR